MSALRDWARLDARWYEDPVLRAAARQAPAAFVMWPVLVGMAKASSHAADNPEGRIVIAIDDLAHACCITNRRAIAAMDALADGGFLDVSAEKVGSVCIRLNSFAKWQTPRKSKAEHKANADFKKCREKAPISNHQVGAKSPSGGGQVAPDVDIDRDVDRDVKTTSSSAKPKRDLEGEAQQVFQHWVKEWGKRSNTVFKGDRKTATIARLREGFTVSQLCESVSGYRHSPHHRGENADRKVWDELELFMRSPAKVDAGIAHGVAAANRAAAGTQVQALSTNPRHAVSEEYDDGIQWHDNTQPAA